MTLRRYVSMLGFLLAAGTCAAAEQQSPEATTVYKPPLRGAPASRIGGGTRGLAPAAPALAVLAPDHTGHTINAQPTLYWFLSKPAPVQIEVTLLDEAGVKPVVEKVLKADMQAGIQALSLKDLGITLKPNEEYRWHVAMVYNAKQRSSDVTSSGTVKLVPQPAALASRLNQSESRRHAVYAEEGLWYDAVDALMQRINAAPGDTRLRDELDALLKQVGLRPVAHQR